MKTNNVISTSSGKDSTTTGLLAIARDVPNRSWVFADTGNEHAMVYEYLEYLELKLGIQIQRVKADFSFDIARKRTKTMKKWRKEGVSEQIIERALEVLQPTGIPFLDLCLWKGSFPSMRRKFCTTELKVKPMQQLFYPMLDRDEMVISWQGVRADESLNRRYLPECDEVVPGLYNYRPILKWSAKDVFQAHKDAGVLQWDFSGKHGIDPNPLYLKGMNRVGCMPCINCGKDELREIAKRFPEEIERIQEWEALVSRASKQGSATLFTSDYRGHGIIDMVEWSKTVSSGRKGGKQYDLIEQMTEIKECKSSYGLCDGGAA